MQISQLFMFQAPHTWFIVAQVMSFGEWLSIIARSELGSDLDCSVINARSELGSDLNCYELMLTKVVFLMLNLNIWLVFSKISNRNFHFSKYFPKLIYRLMFVLDLLPGNGQTFLKTFKYPHI